MTTDDKIALIQCTDSKRDGPCEARKLYDESSLFTKMRRYVNAKDLDYKILSGKHGLVDPDETLEYYNAKGLSADQANEIATEIALMGVGTVEIIAGMDYTNPLVPELEKRGIDVINNFEGQKYGERLESLDIEIHRLLNSDLC